MAQNENLAELSAAGVAVWLDDLSRDRIRSGNLQSLVDEYSVVGVTTNPTIFAAAISGSDSYDDQLHALAVRKVSVEEALRTITAADVRDACDLLAPGRTTGSPATAGSPSRSPPAWRTTPTPPPPRPRTCGGWSTGRTCSSRSRRPRRACRRSPTTIAKGISVNVTLIFSLERYRGGHGRLPRPAWRSGVAETAARSTASRRWPRSSSPAWTPRSTSGWTSRAPTPRSRARPASPTPSWPTRPTRRSSPPTAGGRSRPRAPCRSGRCGPRPGVKNPEYSRHDVHQRAHRPRHGQHHAGEDDDGLRRPRHARARRCRSPTTTPRRS